MTTHIIFDVDNTVTPPRGRMQDIMEKIMDKLYDDPYTNVYFVSGSDLKQIKEQIGANNYHKAANVFGCSGSEDRTGIHFTWEPDKELMKFLKNELSNCTYPIRVGNHIDKRIGSLNFSVIGRFAGPDLREHYAKWDEQTQYRKNLREKLLQKFPDLSVDVGGEISIDIYPKGHGKEQILERLPIKQQNDIVLFFGDKVYEGGNDYRIAQKILDDKLGTVYTVKNWIQTYELVKELF